MLEFSRVSKHFGSQTVLEDVSVRIRPGERVGVVGPNGAGKSTVFSLLMGDQEPDKGDVVVPRGTRLGHLRQQLMAHTHPESLRDYTADAVPRLKHIHEELEELEHAMEGWSAEERPRKIEQLGELQHEYEELGGYELESRADAALSGLGFHVDEFSRPFKDFSGGWQMRAELARTLIADPDVLLLDEPSNYLDVPAVEWLKRFLSGYRGTLLMISHDRYLLTSLTNVTMEVAGLSITRYEGGFDFYTRESAARYEQQLSAKKNQDRKRAEIEEFVNRFRAKNTKAAQVQSRIKMLEKMEEVKVTAPVRSASVIRIPAAPHCGHEVLRIEKAGLTYDNERWVLRGVDVSLKRGERVALVGYNGMGKTTLLRMMGGIRELSTGDRTLGHKVVVGYQSQEFADTMDPNKTAFELVKEAAQGAEQDVRKILGGFGFTRDEVDKPCEVLSGGEKIRLAFARIFVNPPNLLLLDEPTTHLDIQGRRTLEEALRAYQGCVCLVSHDITFIRNVAENIIAVHEGTVTRFHGGYDYFLEKTGEGTAEPVKSDSSSAPVSDRKAEKRKRAEEVQAKNKQKRQLEKTIRKAEEEIERLEAEQAKCIEVVSTPDSPEFARASRRLKEIQYEIEIATSHWEEAVGTLDNFA